MRGIVIFENIENDKNEKIPISLKEFLEENLNLLSVFGGLVALVSFAVEKNNTLMDYVAFLCIVISLFVLNEIVQEGLKPKYNNWKVLIVLGSLLLIEILLFGYTIGTYTEQIFLFFSFSCVFGLPIFIFKRAEKSDNKLISKIMDRHKALMLIFLFLVSFLLFYFLLIDWLILPFFEWINNELIVK